MTAKLSEAERAKRKRAVRITVWILALIAAALYLSVFFRAWR